jgi:hypothetical protein
MQRLTFMLQGAVASGAFFLACGGLDPNDYGAQPDPPLKAGQAGYSYDAGVSGTGGAPSPAGAGGQASGIPKTPRPAEDNQAGAPPATEVGGEAGESGVDNAGGASDGGSGGAAGTAPSDGGKGGTAGQAGSWSWGGRGGTQAGGRGGLGGEAGRGGRSAGGAGGAGGTSGRAGHAGSAGAGEPQPSAAHDFVFSEYVESARAKALEIRAGQASTLAGCELVTYFDSGTVRRIALEGEVASGDVYVLCLQLELVESGVCDRKTDLRFNGDDAIALECGGVALDVIGRLGEDPGTAWEANGASTADQTLRRRCSAPLADADGTDAFDPSAQWLALPVGTVAGLGQSACGEPAASD